MRCRVVGGCSRAALLAARVGRSRPPDGDLVRLRPRLPGRARPQPTGNPTKAFANGLRVVDFETHVTPPALRADASSSSSTSGTGSRQLVSWTYWNSEFTVVGLALLWVYIRRHDDFIQLPQLDPARERDRPARLRADADGAAAPARASASSTRHTRRPHPARREPVRGDAEPARLRLADRRRRARERLPALVGEGLLGRLAGLGLVRRDGDRQPLLARLRRRRRRRADRDGDRLQARARSGVVAAHRA